MILTMTVYAQVSTRIPKSLFGCYVDKQSILAYNGSSRDWDVAENHLGLRPRSSAEVEFEILTIGANGHVCTASGVAQYKKKGNRISLEMVPQPSELPPEFETCSLSILITPEQFRIQTRGSCHAHFMCAARGYLHDATFGRQKRMSLSENAPCLTISLDRTRSKRVKRTGPT